MIIGIGRNEWARGVPEDFFEACKRLNIKSRFIDFNSLSVHHEESQSYAYDQEGRINVTHLLPSLLYRKPSATIAYSYFEGVGVKTLNTTSAIENADNKALTANLLGRAKIPQIATEIIKLDLDEMRRVFRSNDEPLVYKRTHGGQGRWVRIARIDEDLEDIYHYFSTEGLSAIICQPFVKEARGESIRVIVTDGQILCSSLRHSASDWRSNISLGSTQERIELTTHEAEISIRALEAIGLRHGGVDLLKTEGGAKILEINACPDFTSMKLISKVNIAEEILLSTIRAKYPLEAF